MRTCFSQLYTFVFNIYVLLFSYLENSNYDLCQAAAVGDVKLLGWILSCRVSPNVHHGRHNQTPLHYAVLNHNAESSKLLLERGAEIEARTINNQTPLHLAATRNSTEIAQILLEHGAEIEARTLSNQTTLHSAALENSTESAQLLLEHGPEIEARDINNQTPLHYAAYY